MDFNSCCTFGIGGCFSKWNKSSKVLVSKGFGYLSKFWDVFVMKDQKLKRPMSQVISFLNVLKNEGKPDCNIITSI